MHSEKYQFFTQRFLPVRLPVIQTAWFLGYGEHDIPLLVHYGLLQPLGDVTDNCAKYFLVADLEKLRADRRWNDRATATLSDHWRTKNKRPAKPNPHVPTRTRQPVRNPRRRPRAR